MKMLPFAWTNRAVVAGSPRWDGQAWVSMSRRARAARPSQPAPSRVFRCHQRTAYVMISDDPTTNA